MAVVLRPVQHCVDMQGLVDDREEDVVGKALGQDSAHFIATPEDAFLSKSPSLNTLLVP